ncbi:MAG: Gfo/Idh/MocA family protein [Spirochaetota bacterium]
MKQEPPPMRCAVVGLGRIGSLLEDDKLREKPATHAGAIAANPDCLLVAGADLDPERRSRFAERWGCNRLYGDAESMLRGQAGPDGGIDALFIATHPESHLSICRLAADYGVPVVVCEKPLADTLRRARAIRRLHNPPKLTILTNHERRYSKDYLTARSLVREGSLGELRGVTGTLYFGSTMTHREVLLHDGTHMVDIVNFLAGSHLRITRIAGRLNRRKGTSYLHGELRRESVAVPVVLEVGSERDHLVFEVTLSFSRGRLRVGNGVFSLERSAESPHYEGYRSLVLEEPAPMGPTGYFANMVADTVACFREPGREPVSSAVDGYEAMKFIFSRGR